MSAGRDGLLHVRFSNHELLKISLIGSSFATDSPCWFYSCLLGQFVVQRFPGRMVARRSGRIMDSRIIFLGGIRLRAAARGLLAISNFPRFQPNSGFVEFDEALAVEVAEGLFEGFFAGFKGGADFFGGAGVAVGEATTV